jgi:hypothetical protein
MSLLSRSNRRTPASVRLVRAEEAERVPATGAVRSIQEAEVTLPSPLLRELWKPEYLERLARAYWRHITRATLGLIRIVYTDTGRAAVLVSRRLPLLQFHAPDYDVSADQGCVTWRIERGLLVASEGRDNGFLRIKVERHGERPEAEQTELRVQLEVRNFYPWLRGGGKFARFGAWLYGQTQLRIHVLVCNAFLRSLARLELPRSRVGALAGEPPAATPSANGDRTAAV